MTSPGDEGIVVRQLSADEIGHRAHADWVRHPNRMAYVGRFMVSTAHAAFQAGRDAGRIAAAGELAEGIARAIEDLRERTTFQDLTLDSPTDTAAYWARLRAFGEAAALARRAGPSVVYPVEPR